ncbi:hypothetical protein O6H91_17G024500 [Diphasiastrum complanatum]|uniref:Uncharacterized protein n=1 Tax=Diphasiastrum complanatum TaxID=34168 RepID=A0ACC2B509_DIPCM|nr:hypothetical protein O6H91_17G024500 [Diphasiastrum complanatum]
MAVSSTSSVMDAARLRAIAQACTAKEWPYAIRLLTALLKDFPNSPLLLCNRAVCYSKLELHKHAIKDFDKAIEQDASILQAYLHKGYSLVALGIRDKAKKVWKEGYEIALNLPTDLHLVLELHRLGLQDQSKALDTKSEIDDGQNVTQVLSAASLTQEESATSTEKGTIGNNSIKSSSKGCSLLNGRRGNQLFKDQEKKPSSFLHTTNSHMQLREAISEVNNGNYEQAIQLFNQVLSENPRSVGAIIGRGTAFALQRNLSAAISDFTQATVLEPSIGEAWKRRGQARLASAAYVEAISDFTRVLNLDPNSLDTLHERGVANFKLKDYRASIEDMRAYISFGKPYKYTYNYLGLALVAVGYYEEGIKTLNKALELDPLYKEGWISLAQSYQELARSEKAFECLKKALAVDKCYVQAYHMMGVLFHSLGNHMAAIKELTQGLERDPTNTECLYLRASCYHAIGDYVQAVEDYNRILDMEMDCSERCTVQFLAFYQREVALYTVTKLDCPFSCFNIDIHLDPAFKEAWCKRIPPIFLLPSYVHQPRLKVSTGIAQLKTQDGLLTHHKKLLLDAADQLGRKIQYTCPGFSKNRRQYRMAGLAALEIAQKISKVWQDNGIERNDSKVVSGSTRMEVIKLLSFNHKPLLTSWRDLYTIAVRWRQASEPGDPVFWVDMLSEKEFTAGFGSHTPMLLGQAKVIRYHQNIERAYSIVKELILERHNVYNASDERVEISSSDDLKAVKGASSCSELYDIVKEDFWVVSPCASTASKGKVMDGTRITLQKRGTIGFDFSIRTPGTPKRWVDYDAEMAAAWEELCQEYFEASSISSNMESLKKVRDCILRLTYYWYNFMPLARGTAVVGYTTLLGLFLAADMNVTTSIPKGGLGGYFIAKSWILFKGYWILDVPLPAN